MKERRTGRKRRKKRRKKKRGKKKETSAKKAMGRKRSLTLRHSVNEPNEEEKQEEREKNQNPTQRLCQTGQPRRSRLERPGRPSGLSGAIVVFAALFSDTSVVFAHRDDGFDVRFAYFRNIEQVDRASQTQALTRTKTQTWAQTQSQILRRT